MDKVVYINALIDIYGNLLTPKKLNIMKLYYNENYSMQEIADLLNVSKSYVGISIKNSTSKLEELENDLNIYKNKKKINELLTMDNIDKIKEELIKLN